MRRTFGERCDRRGERELRSTNRDFLHVTMPPTKDLGATPSLAFADRTVLPPGQNDSGVPLAPHVIVRNLAGRGEIQLHLRCRKESELSIPINRGGAFRVSAKEL